MHDCAAKGRNPVFPGARNGNSKLSEDDVRQIFALRASGKSQSQIARVVGVNQPHVSRILRGENWSHLA